MTTKNDEPAFPRPDVVWTDAVTGHQRSTEGAPGMSLRDYFAARALQTLLALTDNHTGARVYPSESERVARMAYAMADVMLTERAK